MKETQTPADVAAQLKIGVSTLRKYSLLLEESGVTFKRNAQNSRQYSGADVMALRDMMTLVKSDGITVENAAHIVALGHPDRQNETQESGVMDSGAERHGADIAGVTLHEVRKLQEEIKLQQEIIDGFRVAQEKRDTYFVKILEELNAEIQELKERKSLPEPEVTVQTEKDSGDIADHHEESKKGEIPAAQSKKGIFRRLFRL